MEVHVPHEAVKGRRELFVHLVLIAAGALIALSFEGIATWREHRALVREARANLLNEIRDNRREIDNRLKAIPKEFKQFERALDIADLLQQHKAADGRLELGFETAELQTASRTTAEVTGAFALMEYEEVKKYANVYSRQELFTKIQAQANQDLTRAIAGAGLISQEVAASQREIEDWRSTLRQTAASLLIEEQLGKALLKNYDEILGTPSH